MSGDELQALLDQVEQDCGAEVAEPLRRAVRERDGALASIGWPVPDAACRAVAEWAAENRDVRVDVVRFSDESDASPVLVVARHAHGTRYQAMEMLGRREIATARDLREVVRLLLDQAKARLERDYAAALLEPTRPAQSGMLTIGGLRIPVSDVVYHAPAPDDGPYYRARRDGLDARHEAEFRREVYGEFLTDPPEEPGPHAC